MGHLEQLQAEMMLVVRNWQLVNGKPADLELAVRLMTAGWRATKKTRHKGPERFYEVITPDREPTGPERELDTAREARDEWVYRTHDESVPPPLSVTTRDLLDQKVWWIAAEQRVMRIDDMTPEHRVNLLAHLNKRALGLQMDEWMSGLFLGAPDEVADQAAEETAIHWLHRQPLVRRLKTLIRRDRKQSGRAPGEPPPFSEDVAG